MSLSTMTRFADDLDMENFMKEGSDLDGVKQIWTALQTGATTVMKFIKSSRSFIAVKAMVKTDATVEDIKQSCQQIGVNETWAKEFLTELPNHADPSTNIIDPEKACQSLSHCYDKCILKSLGCQVLANSLYSFIKSFMTWRLISTFILPDHENLIKRTKEKLEQCALLCVPLIPLEQLNLEQFKTLDRVQELLTDIKDALQLITCDIENKIAEAERLRSNSYISSFTNFLTTVLNGWMFTNIAESIGDNSNAGVAFKFATVIQGACTIGDLIHAKKAGLLVEELQKRMRVAKELEDEYNHLLNLRNDLSKKHQTV